MKVAILTNFMEFNPGYSLTGIVMDQCRMLSRYGHEVDVFVNDQYNPNKWSGPEALLDEGYSGIKVKPLIPFAHLKDYSTKKDIKDEHKKTIEDTAEVFRKELVDVDIVFTHDFVFTGWFLPYGLACAEATQDLRKTRWLHWIHSVPSANRDWWRIDHYGNGHKLVFPVKTERTRVAEQFGGSPSDVRIIPHIKDMRSWFNFGRDTCDFIDSFPAVMQGDVVCTYPASSDRLAAKGIDKIMYIMSRIKKYNFSVFLVIANQWATGTQPKQDIDKFKKVGVRNGLKLNEEFCFTSEWAKTGKYPEYENGIPGKMLREIEQMSNLFIFPTKEESFGLVAPEAALAGGCLMVLNKSLTMLQEVHGFNGFYADFGSFHQNFEPVQGWDAYLNDITTLILGRMREDDSLTEKTFIRQTYNWDTLYSRYYAPIMGERILW